MAIAEIALGVDFIPCFWEGGNLRVTGRVVLLQCNAEFGTAGEGDVELAAVVGGHVTAGTSQLCVEGVVAV